MISNDAIERYLKRPMPYVPQFKHMVLPELRRRIYNCTGLPLQEFKTPALGNYQIEGLAHALYLRGGLLFYSPQLGKSWVALNWAEHLLKAGLWRHGKGLIIGYSPTALDVWEDQTAEHSSLTIRVVHLSFDELIDALDSDCDLIVVSWYGLQAMFTDKYTARNGRTKRYTDTEKAHAVARYIGLAIIDEIHMAMHHNSLRFQIAAILTEHAKFRLGLTGTPYGRSPYALWAEAFLIDRGKTFGTNYYFFEQAFGKARPNFWSGRTEFHFDKKKLPTLQHKLSNLALVYQRHECRDVSVLMGTVNLRMHGDQLRAYQEATTKWIHLTDGQQVEIHSTFHRMRQISSGFLPITDDDGKTKHVVEFASNAKRMWLREFMERLQDAVTVIIYHEYVRTGEIICAMLNELKVEHQWLYGGSKDGARIVRDFKAGGFRVLVSNVNKGGVSISLPEVNYILFYESPVSPIIRQQAESRPMARGNRLLTIDDLLCSGIERRILSYIQEGKDLSAALNSTAVRKALADDIRSSPNRQRS